MHPDGMQILDSPSDQIALLKTESDCAGSYVTCFNSQLYLDSLILHTYNLLIFSIFTSHLRVQQ